MGGAIIDAFHLMASGRVGKVHGLRTDRYKRLLYRFSMACNRMVGGEQETLWLQVSVPEPLCELVSERGLLVGENVLIMTDTAQLAATLQGESARAWLNVTARQVVFLENLPLPQLERGAGFKDRLIDYSQLMTIKAG